MADAEKPALEQRRDRARAGDPARAAAQGRDGRAQRHPRNPRRHRRRRGLAVRRRPVPHVRALRRQAGLEGRGRSPRAKARWAATRKSSPRSAAAAPSPSSNSNPACIACSACPTPRRPGRIHTSAATVAVLPEAEDVDIDINDDDLKIDTMRAQRRRRPARQQDRIGDPHHPYSDRHRRDGAGGALAAQEPRQGDGDAARQALRRRAAASSTPRAPPSGAARSAPATAPSASAPTIFRKAASPTTASISRSTSCRRSIEGEALGEIIDALVTEHQAELLAAQNDARMTQTAATSRRRMTDRRRARGALLTALSRTPASIRPSSTRACWSATRSASTTPALAVASRPRARPPTKRDAHRRARSAAARARAGRAHSRHEGILGPAACAVARRRWCRGRRPRPWSRRRSPRSTRRRADARAAHRRSRHRLGRAAARAAVANCRTRAASAPISAATALACARDNAAALGLARARVVRGLRLSARRSHGAFDLVVSNPPYVASGDIAGLAARGARLRSAPRARRRRRRPRRLSRDRRATRAGCSRRAAHLVVELGVGQDARRGRAVHSGGACAARPRAPILPASRARLHALRCHNDAMTLAHCRYAKKHLDCRSRPTRFRARNRPEITARRYEPRSDDCGEPTGAKARDVRSRMIRQIGSPIRDRDASSVTRRPRCEIDAALRMTRGGQRRREGCGQGVAAS